VASELSSTSYAVLSLLGVREWSAYELTQQMTRSLSWYWPKAESLVYAECKKLAEHGLAQAHREHHGRRPRTVYRITGTGRAALRDWLDRDLPPRPRLEFEALLQVAFADHGIREQLLENLKAIRADAEDRRDRALAQAADYADTGGPYPERLPVIALTAKFFIEYTDLLARWAAWAETVAQDWSDVRPTGATVPTEAFQPGCWHGP